MKAISVQNIVEASSGDIAIAVNATADVYSNSFSIKYANAMVLMYKATVTTGTPDVDVYLEQSSRLPAGTSGGGEGEAGNATDGWHQVGSKIADITSESWGSVTLSPVTLPYLRIKLDGQGSNPSTCTVELRLGLQEEIF